MEDEEGEMETSEKFTPNLFVKMTAAFELSHLSPERGKQSHSHLSPE
jgi:hypothetical protein